VAPHRIRENCEQRDAVGEPQLAGVAAEVPPRRLLDAVHARSELGHVQVPSNLSILGHDEIEEQRARRLAELSYERLATAQEHVLHQLLGDRAGAPDDAALGEVAAERDRNRGAIEAVMAKELGVFRCDQRCATGGAHFGVGGPRLATRLDRPRTHDAREARLAVRFVCEIRHAARMELEHRRRDPQRGERDGQADHSQTPSHRAHPKAQRRRHFSLRERRQEATPARVRGAKRAALAIGVLVLACLAAGCAPESPACETRLSLDLCARIGQMLLVGFGGEGDPQGARFDARSAIARDIAQLRVGGVLLYARANGAGGRNIHSPAQLATLVAELQAFSAKSRARAELDALPLLVALDQEGGAVDRLPVRLGFSQRTVSAQALGGNQMRAAHDPAGTRRAIELSRGYAGALAAQLRELGINLNLAPCVDVNVDPASPAIGGLGRSFSSDPEVVSDQAWAFVRGFHEHGVLATLKHFPGHGSASGDSHRSRIDVTHTYRRELELAPYRRLIALGYRDVVLVGHLVNGRVDRTQCKAGRSDDPRTWCPASMSRAVVTGLLRNALGFDGVIAADDMTMRALTREYALDVALERAIRAGVELFLVGNHARDSTRDYVDTIATLVAQRRVDTAQIQRASDRIRALKQRIAALPASAP